MKKWTLLFFALFGVASAQSVLEIPKYIAADAGYEENEYACSGIEKYWITNSYPKTKSKALAIFKFVKTFKYTTYGSKGIIKTYLDYKTTEYGLVGSGWSLKDGYYEQIYSLKKNPKGIYEIIIEGGIGSDATRICMTYLAGR